MTIQPTNTDNIRSSLSLSLNDALQTTRVAHAQQMYTMKYTQVNMGLNLSNLHTLQSVIHGFTVSAFAIHKLNHAL